MRRLLEVSTLILSLSVPIAFRAQSTSSVPFSNRPDQSVASVSMIQLIANPKAYDGKKVQLIGFFRLEFEGTAIYLHKEDFLIGISKDALRVDLPSGLSADQKKALDLGYVICEGTFRAKELGHMGSFSGAITQINRLQPWVLRRDETTGALLYKGRPIVEK